MKKKKVTVLSVVISVITAAIALLRSYGLVSFHRSRPRLKLSLHPLWYTIEDVALEELSKQLPRIEWGPECDSVEPVASVRSWYFSGRVWKMPVSFVYSLVTTTDPEKPRLIRKEWYVFGFLVRTATFSGAGWSLS